jgi:hypothetical protein
MKVAKSQHAQLQKLLIEQSTNPLPGSLQDSLALITIPFFYVVNLKIRFYLLFQINGDLYGIYEWASEDLPIKDTDVGEVILLCRQFLIYKVCVFIIIIVVVISLLLLHKPSIFVVSCR